MIQDSLFWVTAIQVIPKMAKWMVAAFGHLGSLGSRL
jgi:hypothetical protein